MGYSLKEAEMMTFKEFYFLDYGHSIREQKEWDKIRLIVSTTINWSGKTSKDFVDHKSIMRLPLIDQVYEHPKVTTIEQAEAIFKSFL